MTRCSHELLLFTIRNSEKYFTSVESIFHTDTTVNLARAEAFGPSRQIQAVSMHGKLTQRVGYGVTNTSLIMDLMEGN